MLHAMLECYFDDSADPRRAKYYACGGLIGGSGQWDWLDGRWSHETRDLKKPFRSTECECQHGQFTNCPKPQCDDLMARLVGVVKECDLHGFASIVPVQDYRAAFPGCGEHDAFYLAVTQTIMCMADIANNLNEDAGLWFEDSSVYPTIAEIYRTIKQSNWRLTSRLRSIDRDTKELRPLQSADLVAREAFKHIDNYGVRPTRKPVRELKENLYFIVWNAPALKYLAEHGGRTNIEFLATWDTRPDAPRLGMHWKTFSV